VARQDTLPDFIEKLRRDVVKAAEKIGKKPPAASRQPSGNREDRRS